MPKTLRLILGDQLNARHSWYEEANDDVTYALMECRSETDYVRHHVQKVVGFFLAMRQFARYLENQGLRVIYLKLDDPENAQSIAGNIKKLVEQQGFGRFEYQLPDEYRLDISLKELCEELSIETVAFDTEHFYASREELADFFAGKKQCLLESFYRYMRRKHNVLMESDGETPLTGRWNYDEENRKKLPNKVAIPENLHFRRDVTDLVEMIEAAGVQTIGRIDPKAFHWPVNREESLRVLDNFLEKRLRNFGRYQDAMTDRDYWLFHSKLSFSMNTKMLDPREVVDATVSYWSEHSEEIDIAQVEGFVRQILGWREYMRGVYWARMPAYAERNFLEHEAPLPEFYWTGETKMKCMQQAVGQSLDHAYAHHIQRLMVTGNFALLAGVHPDEVDAWYLGIYMDAIEWVEITNTRGMSQFADGGIVGTKPYVSSANYIHKMSDHCAKCHYDRKKKTGEGACPFNSLYWAFYDRHTDKLGNNPRVGMMYNVWKRMGEERQRAILGQAEIYLERINEL